MKSILIIEPNQALAKTYAKTFELYGFKPFLASGAQTAIDVADTYSPDIVLLELQLADHSGLEFLYEFRSYTDWRNVPVIINTVIPADRLGESTAAFKQFGISQVLYKPRTSLTQLMREVRKLL